MEEGHYHHHHHHHHGHHTNNQDQQGISEQRPIATVPIAQQGSDKQTNLTAGNGVLAASSFHSVSSIDSSAEMAKYFPNAQTPSLSPFSRNHQKSEGQETKSTIASSTRPVTNASTINAGPYISVPAPRMQQLAQRAPIRVQQQPVRAPLVRQPPPGIPSYSSQIQGLSISQALVNDVIVDLQSKILNESQQQYQSDSSSGNYLEPLAPVHIRAPNPTIILRSDLSRLRAELNQRVKPPEVHRHPRGINQFQTPSFPPPPAFH